MEEKSILVPKQQTEIFSLSPRTTLFIRLGSYIISYISFYTLFVLLVPPFILYCSPNLLGTSFTNVITWKISKTTDIREANLTGYAVILPTTTTSIMLWHVVPKSAAHLKEFEQQKLLLDRFTKIVFYVHGNYDKETSQMEPQRLKKFTDDNWHVITCQLNEVHYSRRFDFKEHIDGIQTCYRWLRSRTSHNMIIAWGKSIGAPILSAALAELHQREGVFVPGIVLESPIYNVEMLLVKNTLFKLVFWNEVTRNFALDWGLSHSGLDILNTLEHQKRMASTPLMILHAKDDKIVPPEHGDTLRNDLKNSKKVLSLVPFGGCHNYGHEILLKSHEAIQLLTGFAMETSRYFDFDSYVPCQIVDKCPLLDPQLTTNG